MVMRPLQREMVQVSPSRSTEPCGHGETTSTAALVTGRAFPELCPPKLGPTMHQLVLPKTSAALR